MTSREGEKGWGVGGTDPPGPLSLSSTHVAMHAALPTIPLEPLGTWIPGVPAVMLFLPPFLPLSHPPSIPSSPPAGHSSPSRCDAHPPSPATFPLQAILHRRPVLPVPGHHAQCNRDAHPPAHRGGSGGGFGHRPLLQLVGGGTGGGRWRGSLLGPLWQVWGGTSASDLSFNWWETCGK